MLNERHLRLFLRDYVRYYNTDLTRAFKIRQRAD